MYLVYFDRLLDIIDMVKYNLFNRGYKYILLAVDVFSRKVFIEPIKSKDIPHVLQGFKELTKHEKPRSILSDHEPAFIGNEFYEYLKKQEIVLNVNKLGDHKSLGMLENLENLLSSHPTIINCLTSEIEIFIIKKLF
jgi:hypothetical protein